MQLYWVDPQTRNYILLTFGKYTTCCLLDCKFVPGQDFIAVAATDGYVAFFPSPLGTGNNQLGQWTWASRFQIHQSSVKCIEMIPISGTRVLSLILIREHLVHLFTGGDDNAVHLVELTFAREISCKHLACIPEAHASTVTGVLSLGEMKLLSVGIDQYIRIWKYDGANLTHLYEAYTFVPDVGGIVEIGAQSRHRCFVIFGTGMELISWKEKHDTIETA